jgi:hypothetical protein
MRIFRCPRCGAELFFDNLVCGCGFVTGYDPAAQGFVADPAFCANRAPIGCNWVRDGASALCASCLMTAVHPDLSVPGNAALWVRAERAKRHVLAGLMRWGWLGAADPGPRPAFHMLAEATATGRVAVSMGHAAGLVTINLAEADAAEQVRRREMLGEPYRTMIGHLRHELAHFLFARLAGTAGFLDAFRARFGDERQDYAAALARHYAEGPPPGWQEDHVTPYATAHPHEDWAESAAHAMHLTDIADSFAAAGLGLAALPMPPGWDAFAERDAAALLEAGIAIGVALNHVNRAVGQPDLYPFVSMPATRAKLSFALERLAAGPAG